ncbi:TraR/DksA family transcriptional regulator [Stutzerimonas urumqiensis]|uniref:TraR/DksA family transcriptional regulator n=1 Tax=Stutzerimonas urumqiensis TaxID=638269 RepID=UPI003DA6C9F5
MSTLTEIAEAYAAARTATEQGDRASSVEELDRLGGVALVRARLNGHGAEFCEECGEPIPIARRRAAPWVVCCVDCASIREARRG